MDLINLADCIKPELLILIPVLYFVGIGLKHLQKIADNYIPLLLGIAGIILAALYVLATTTCTSPNDWFMAVFVGLTQGVLCAGCSVYANQIVKQLQKPKE